MSGPAIHHIIAREHLSMLKNKYNDSVNMQLWNEIDSGAYASIYLFGAQGPDFLFFNMNDWPKGIKSIAEVYFDVQEFLCELHDMVTDMIPPELWLAIDKLEQGIDRSATLSEIEQFCNDVKNNINAIKTKVETYLEEYVINSFDLFNLLKHPQQHGQDFKEWWWFDTLHIRRTGQFLFELMNRSSNLPQERAYALGYLTHYATDTVGHPFVNIISGGPYRTHSQRHKVVENLHDVWAFSRYMHNEFISSNLANSYVINSNPETLPKGLNDFMLSCIKSVYYDGGMPLYGKDITNNDLDLAYKNWLIWFTRVTNDTGLPLPQPYQLTAEIIEAWNKFKNNVGDITDYVGNSLQGNHGLRGFFAAIAALIAGPIILGALLVDFVIGEIQTLGFASMRYLLSLSYEALYNSYMYHRSALALNGLAFPMRTQLENFLVSHMINSGAKDVYQHDSLSLPNAQSYPACKFSDLGSESHLVYPVAGICIPELDSSVGCPRSYYSADPSHYMDDMKLRFVQSSYNYYQKFVEYDPATNDPTSIARNFGDFANFESQGGLGNAVLFSNALYSDFLLNGKATKYIDFSLDSDRGYAFKSWRKVESISLLNSSINDYLRTNVPIEADKKVPNVQTDILYPDGSLL